MRQHYDSNDHKKYFNLLATCSDTKVFRDKRFGELGIRFDSNGRSTSGRREDMLKLGSAFGLSLFGRGRTLFENGV